MIVFVGSTKSEATSHTMVRGVHRCWYNEISMVWLLPRSFGSLRKYPVPTRRSRSRNERNQDVQRPQRQKDCVGLLRLFHWYIIFFTCDILLYRYPSPPPALRLALLLPLLLLLFLQLLLVIYYSYFLYLYNSWHGWVRLKLGDGRAYISAAGRISQTVWINKDDFATVRSSCANTTRDLTMRRTTTTSTTTNRTRNQNS